WSRAAFGAAGVRESKTKIGERQQGDAQAGVDEPVVEQVSLQRHRARVLLRDAPVFGDLVLRDAAEGIEERRQRLVLELAGEAGGDEGAEQERGGARMDGEHAPARA